MGRRRQPVAATFYGLIFVFIYKVVGWRRTRRLSGAHQTGQSGPVRHEKLYLTDPDGYFLCFQWKA